MSKTIRINGESKIFENLNNLSDLIKHLELNPEKIAIEKDFEIINHVDFDKTILNDNCKIEIVHFIGGG